MTDASAARRPHRGGPPRLPRRPPRRQRRGRGPRVPAVRAGGPRPHARTGRSWTSRPPATRACSRARLGGASLPLEYELEVDYGENGSYTVGDPYRFLPTLGDMDLLPRGRGPPRGAVGEARRARDRAPGRAGHRLRGLGTERALRLDRRRLQLLGRPAAPDAVARLERHLGALPAGRRRRRQLQVRDPHAVRRDPAQGRPARLRHRAAAQDGLGHPPPRARLARRGVARGAAPRRRSSTSRSPSTRSTSAPGGSTRSRATARSPTSSSPTSCRPTRRTWASPTSSCCR